MALLLSLSLAGGLLGLLVYLFAARKGMFDGLEETKYQVFHEEGDED